MSINKRISIIRLMVIAGIILAVSCTERIAVNELPQPVAKQIARTLSIHGHDRIDNYYWLNDRNNPEVVAYLEAENSYTEAQMAHTSGLQETLFREIVGRIKQDDASVPYKEAGYWYYERFEEGQEYPYVCRRKGTMAAPEEVLLNVNELARGHNYYKVVGETVSNNNSLLAFGVDTLSRRQYTIHFKDLSSGEILPDRIPNTTGSVAWAADNRTVFYTVKDEETLRPYKIMRHRLGTSPEQDVVVFQEEDVTFYSYVYLSKSREYVMIGSFSTLSSEYRCLPAAKPDAPFRVVLPREANHEYNVWHYGDSFYLRTNDHAQNFRLVKTPVNRTDRQFWQEIIPHSDQVLLEDLDVFRDFLVVSERKDGLKRIRILDQKTGEEHLLRFEEPAYTIFTSVNADFDTDLLRFGYSSLTTPRTIYDYDMNTREKTLLKRDPVLGNFDPANYKTERLMATARDGVQVPISLVYRKDHKKPGSNPLLLYGYGSYGSSTDPDFRSSRLSLIDRGFIYAIAHIRGGEEMGRKWYEDGKLLKKMNTFTDFIDCGEFLIREGYTSREDLYALGGSAGGLLTGAVVNLRPDLFKGVISAVPFVDVVTTMLDESIPLTTGEYDEWGNPNDETYYRYMLSYSPYDNVTAQAYPNMLVTTGLHDSQVQYWEPAKWVAKLRALKTDNHVLLLRTQMETGHSGASGRFERYRETAMEFAFLLDLAGIEK